MIKPQIIGITGGIGSGKSTVSELLRSQGYPVYDTDREARRLQNEDPELIDATKLLLGDQVYANGQLNRPAVAARVFEDPELLRQLTALVHPVVKRDFSQWVSQQSSKRVFIESAVLFEGGFDALTDAIIVITAPEEVRIQRVMKRDGVTREQVLARIKNQLPESGKLIKASIIISTENGLPSDLTEQINAVFKL